MRRLPCAPTLRITASHLFEPHNVWSTEPVLRLSVRCTPADLAARIDREATIARIERELARLPGNPQPAFDLPGTSADTGMLAIGDLIGQSALAMQQCLGDAVSFSTTVPGQTPDEIEIVVACRYGSVAQAAAHLATRLVSHAIDSSATPFDVLAEWEREVAAIHPSRTCRPEIRSILAAAAQRGIPVRSLDPARRLVELGTGAYGRRFWNLATSGTSHLGVKIAKDKHLANVMLRNAGVPVPRSMVVTTAAEAATAAAQLGYPVVLKPNLGSQGRNVFVAIPNETELLELGARAFANRSTGEWLVEEYVPGNEHRVLVIGGQVVAVNLRTPASVTGDGSSTVQALIDTLNADPARSFSSGFTLKPVVPGAQLRDTLRRQGLELDSVPAPGQRVPLNSVSNVSAGGSAHDVTDRMHPDNARIACMAAAVVGLDFAGIDLVVPDIAQSMLETGGAIIEINSHPGVIDHLQPASGPPRDIGAAILADLYPPGQPYRVPVVAVTADEASAALCRSIAEALTGTGRSVGLATRDGLYIDGLHFRGADGRNPAGPRTLLNNPVVEVAVVEVDAQSIVDHGLGFGQCDVAIVSSLSGLQTPFGEPVEIVLLRALDAKRHCVAERRRSVPGSAGDRIDPTSSLLRTWRRRRALCKHQIADRIRDFCFGESR